MFLLLFPTTHLKVHGCFCWNHAFLYPKKTNSQPTLCESCIHLQQWKKRPYFPWNPGCLMTGSLFHDLWNNPPYNWAVISSPTKSPKQPGTYRTFHCSQNADSHHLLPDWAPPNNAIDLWYSYTAPWLPEPMPRPATASNVCTHVITWITRNHESSWLNSGSGILSKWLMKYSPKYNGVVVHPQQIPEK